MLDGVDARDKLGQDGSEVRAARKSLAPPSLRTTASQTRHLVKSENASPGLDKRAKAVLVMFHVKPFHARH
jgi:hypothetical protein